MLDFHMSEREREIIMLEMFGEIRKPHRREEEEEQEHYHKTTPLWRPDEK